MNGTGKVQSDLTDVNERLAKAYYSNGHYMPLFLAGVGVGLIVIFLLTQFGLLGEPAPQLLYIGGATLLFAVAHIPLLALAQRNQGVTATLYNLVVVGIFGILLTLFWQEIWLVTILIVLITLLMPSRNGMPPQQLPTLFLSSLVIVVIIFFADRTSPFVRLQNNTAAATASIIFVLATILLLITITIISQNKNFHSLQSLLLTSFAIIVLVPTVMTALLAGIGVYTNSQTQMFNSLEAITTLKTNQIEALVKDSEGDTQRLLADPRFITNTLQVLTAPGQTTSVKESFKRVARTRMVGVLGAEQEAYSEIMVIDAQGNVAISTIPSNEGLSLREQPLFVGALSSFYAGFSDEPSFGSENFVVATPIVDTSGAGIRGILVLR